MSVTDRRDDVDDDENRPESPELKRARELHEAYRARFGEWPPMFVMGNDPIAEIEEALKTDEPIKDQTPPGCVS